VESAKNHALGMHISLSHQTVPKEESMIYNPHVDFEDYLLPNAEEMHEFLHDDEEDLITETSPIDDDFNEEPEAMALWMEHASHHFIKN
jgi:hypothetical protein